MDIEWAHAIAPMANIDLFEATNDGNTAWDLGNLFTAVHTADNTPGVVCRIDELGRRRIRSGPRPRLRLTTPRISPRRRATWAVRPRWAAPSIAGGITYLVASGDAGAYGDGFPYDSTPDA